MNKRIRNKKEKQRLIKFIVNRYHQFASKKEILKIIRKRKDNRKIISTAISMAVFRPFGFCFYDLNNENNWRRNDNRFNEIMSDLRVND